jgi:hypothetical protein
MTAGLVFCTRFIILCIWHLVSLMVAALVVGSFISLADPGQPSVDLAPLLAISFLETAVMVWVISRLKLTGIKLLVATLIIFHGVKVFLMMIELAFFLNIWASPALISLERVFGLELHGLFMALLFCPMAILVMKKWKADEQSPAAIFPLSNRSLVIRILGVSALYSVCYWLAGSHLLIPIAGESFAFTYSHLQVPGWMPFFQAVRNC